MNVEKKEIISILISIDVLVLQGKTLDLACKESWIARQIYYRWRQEFVGMQVNPPKEFKKIKKENVRLKKLVAEISLEKFV